MASPLPNLPGNFLDAACCVVGVALAVIITVTIFRSNNLDAFPTVGRSTLLGSLWAGLSDQDNLTEVMEEGYRIHNSAPFKVADRCRWVVILSNRDHLEELSRASEDELSVSKAVDEQLNICHTLGPDLLDIPYHVAVVRSQLTRSIGTEYSEIRDEIFTAFDEVLDLKGDEWKGVLALNAIQNVVCRASNRLFVGLPLCRDSGWIDLNIHCSVHIVKEGFAIGLFPGFLRPLAACFYTGVARGIQQGMKHLGPIIEERLRYLNEYGSKWDESSNDLLSWLMEKAEGQQLTVRSLVTRILFINFAAIHTTSSSFAHALFYLVMNPQYIQPLREEVECIVEKEGWSKTAIGKMHRVDSFLRECQRLKGLNSLTLIRKAIKNFTFSDGTFIPKGTTIGAPSQSLQCDERFYKNAHTFEPFRFAEGDREGAKHQFASTAIDYLPFGHGKHSCPGRFFAATELKLMLAHLVVMYDIKLEENMTPPRSLHISTSIIPDPHAKVLFRKRFD